MKHIKNFENFNTIVLNENNIVNDKIQQLANFLSKKISNNDKDNLAKKINSIFGINPYDENLDRDETLNKIAQVLSSKYGNKFEPLNAQLNQLQQVSNEGFGDVWKKVKGSFGGSWDYDDNKFKGVIKGIVIAVGGLLGFGAIFGFLISGIFSFIGALVSLGSYDELWNGPMDFNYALKIAACFIWSIIVAIVATKVTIAHNDNNN